MISQRLRKILDITRLYKFIKLKLLRHSATPEELATSFAVGAFIGILPTFGLASILSILAAIFLKIPKIPCFLGTLIANPWTAPVFYTFSWKIGNYFFDVNPRDVFSGVGLRELMPVHIFVSNVIQIYKPLLTGGFIIALPGSIVIYYLILFFLIKFKKIRRKKLYRDL
jgi:uncharacterized protein (DUF2062 family)